MGEIELIKATNELKIHSTIYLYGDLATEQITQEFVTEIEDMWNEPEGVIELDGEFLKVTFEIEGIYKPNLTQYDVLKNTNPRNNYFRIEDFSPLHISWVDGINSNTGYMLIDNLYKGSTTAAHEYGHTLGLKHPENLVLIGKGTPGIMYPRGTLVDREYQYDPNKETGEAGGTMHPMYRKVKQEDIDLLELPKLIKRGFDKIGNFSSLYHEKHISKEERIS